MAIVKVTIVNEIRDSPIHGLFKWENEPTNIFVVGDSMLSPDAGSELAVKIRTILREHHLVVHNEKDW